MSVGESLAAARSDAGLSIEDVAADTRIRATVIRAMESDNFEPCGGSVYARGHIRSIARVLGVDAGPIVAEFDRAHHVEPRPVSATAPAQSTDRTAVARSERHGPNWAAAMITALVVICGLAAVGLLRHHHSSGTTNTAGQTSHTQATTPPTHAPSATQPPSTVVPVSHKASMLIRSTTGASWIEVKSASGTVLFEGLLSDGHSKLFTDKHGLNFIIGDTRAVDVTVNGHDIGSPHTATVVLKGSVKPGARTVSNT